MLKQSAKASADEKKAKEAKDEKHSERGAEKEATHEAVLDIGHNHDEASFLRSALLPMVITRWQPDRVGVFIFGVFQMERGIFQQLIFVLIAQVAAYIFAILKAQFS